MAHAIPTSSYQPFLSTSLFKKERKKEHLGNSLNGKNPSDLHSMSPKCIVDDIITSIESQPINNYMYPSK